MSGTALSPASEPQKVPDLWFESDSLVIRAGDRLIRVSPSQLGKRAKALGDILSMPNSGLESYEGCPVVELQDDPVEVEAFLRTLFDPFLHGISAKPSARHTAGILRLSHKYDAPSLRQRTLQYLADSYPTTLSGFDAGAREIRPSAEAAMIFDVATETQALWLVPFAMLSWVHADAKQFTADVPASDTLRLEFDTQTRHSAWSMREQYRVLWTRFIVLMFDADLCPEPVSMPANSIFAIYRPSQKTRGCALSNGRCAAYLRKTCKQELTTPSYRCLAILEPNWLLGKTCDMCANCTMNFIERHERLRQEFWGALPEIFGVSGWTELEVMKAKDLGAKAAVVEATVVTSASVRNIF
ncbi:uncharacterized protein SCHCODRAFT_02593088 [Schizophyllum commune H4-8]|nr:uncharacterized protein SCHCODRAFT_02593088 [Schizophyllum commune H4-8]KAI5886217.1 hypothetical protein SCHCODRAFT_02593088 [Schizophyllum commune H4-8]